MKHRHTGGSLTCSVIAAAVVAVASHFLPFLCLLKRPPLFAWPVFDGVSWAVAVSHSLPLLLRRLLLGLLLGLDLGLMLLLEGLVVVVVPLADTDTSSSLLLVLHGDGSP